MYLDDKCLIMPVFSELHIGKIFPNSQIKGISIKNTFQAPTAFNAVSSAQSHRFYLLSCLAEPPCPVIVNTTIYHPMQAKQKAQGRQSG